MQPDDCQWIASKLEEMPSGDPDLLARMDAHLADCAPCRREMEAYEKVDRLLAAYVSQRTRTAAQGALIPSRPLRLAMAGAGLLVALLGIWLVAGGRGNGDRQGTESQAVVKAEDGTEALRAKPEPGVAEPTGPPGRAAEAGTDFYVSDNAGYLSSLSDFSGDILILGVFDRTGRGREGFERLWRTYRSVPGVQALGVLVSDPQASEAGPSDLPVTASGAEFPFPTFSNRGSTLKSTGPGEFSIIGLHDGNVRLRGSLEDEALDRIVAANLAGAGIVP